MNRELLLEIEAQRAHRLFMQPFELRASTANPDLLIFEGFASVTEREYPIMGGEWPGWMETIAKGAFKRTLRNKADVAFLVNHGGMTLARTKSGTLTLDEVTDGDPTGLHVLAELDRRIGPVNDLYVASERGDVDEMSFAFWVVKAEWYDDNGQPSNAMDGTKRRITEINLNKGDVSAVNYGANDATSGGFRQIEQAVAELRAGRPLSDDARTALRTLLADETDQETLDANVDANVEPADTTPLAYASAYRAASASRHRL